MLNNSTISGQIILIGTAVCDNQNTKVAIGSRCAMISVVDCNELERTGRLEQYVIDDGINAGAFLDDTLGPFGWADIRIKSALPIANKTDGWEPEIAALIKTAKTIGFAHMVFEPQCEKPILLH